MGGRSAYGHGKVIEDMARSRSGPEGRRTFPQQHEIVLVHLINYVADPQEEGHQSRNQDQDIRPGSQERRLVHRREFACGEDDDTGQSGAHACHTIRPRTRPATHTAWTQRGHSVTWRV